MHVQWGNPYCYAFLNCTRNNKAGGDVAAWMYDTAHDAQYAASVTNLLFPRILIAAAAFWSFDQSVFVYPLGTGNAAFMASYSAHAERIKRRVPVLEGCPVNCTCTPTSKCGTPYPRATRRRRYQ